ncbi:MAG: DUF3786 domain-containing protein [Eubacteriales bacterium]|nr:DUF3786 domain-containing protein [Eubacteriales bacterium]
MSVNYHAFQSRGVLFSNHETVCRQWREEFSGYDPGRIARILHLEADGQFLYVPYFGEPYRLCLADGRLERLKDGEWTDELYFNEAMAVYHLLHYTKDVPVVSGKWVPGHTVDGVVSRQPTADPLLDPFVRSYTGRMEELRAACEAAGGTRLSAGDVSYEFEAFPCVHLQLVFWDADEDFPAQAQVLVDQCVTDFVHYETVGCILSDLLERIGQDGPAAPTGRRCRTP